MYGVYVFILVLKLLPAVATQSLSYFVEQITSTALQVIHSNVAGIYLGVIRSVKRKMAANFNSKFQFLPLG